MAKPQVGVQEITDAAGVPKSSFYNHFDSKKTVGSEIRTLRYERERVPRSPRSSEHQ